MQLRKVSVFLNGAIGALILSMLGALLFTIATPVGAAQAQTGVSGTVQGVTVTLAELRSRPVPPKFATPRQASPRRTFSGSSAPPSAPASSIPAVAPSAAPSTQSGTGEKLPQALVDEILGLQITDTAGFVPPDTMGAVGPTQFLFSVNDHLRAYNKNSPHTQIFDIDEVAFWGNTADPAGVSDTHVRYDRLSQRWFITEIDVPNGNNHILLAVSSSSDLSTATWTQFAIPTTNATHDNGCFADYDTPGIDQNGIYIGENMFGGVSPCNGNYLHTNLYVIQKSSALTNTVHFTIFFNVATGSQGIVTIQGVDSVDSLTTGYAIAVKETESPRQHLNVWQINNPSTTSPTLSGPTAVTISAENGAEGGVLSHNNVVSSDPSRPMDDIDDRLFSAVIRNGHLWTAHNVIVDSSGNSNGGTRNRDAVRWFDINVSGLTVNQSGTVFDSAASGFLEYWMGTVMVSGQGHVAMGLNRANSTTNVQAGALGRLAGDAAGTLRGFSLFQNSTGDAYDDSFFVGNPANRWGDYTYTSLDPCDDMTMWTTQEYVAGSADSGVDWATAAEKLQAPGPAVLPAGPVASVPVGQSSTPLALIGTSPSGQGFYDTPSSADPSCRTRLTAGVTNGAVVTSVTYQDPLHVALTLNTTAATAGTATVTLTNPDGQTTSTTFTLAPAAPTGRIDSIGIFRPSTNSFYMRLHNSTGFADITVAYNPFGTSADPVVGDWTGAGFDTVGMFNKTNGLFALCTSNSTTNCANSGNILQLVLGNPNDTPLGGRWQSSASHFGVGVFRPSNGLIYIKNALSTGFADDTMVLGIPGDTGLAGDWNGDGLDSPGVYRNSNSTFYLTDLVCNCSVFGSYQFVYGVSGDAPVVGDWTGLGHDGVGLFRQSNGFTYLKNALTTGFADISFTFGVAGDVPVAGHWQLVYPPIPNPGEVLAPPPAAPGKPGSGQPGSNGLGD